MLRGDGNNQSRARFKILGPLGAGGFGAVYEAVDALSGQHVALKELDDTSADSIARFKQEFRALSECHHENLVGVRELIEQDGRWLIVMELVPGVDFLRHVRAADNDNVAGVSYDEGMLRGALIGVLRGLSALHRFGLVHRDLKPSNVRVRPDGRAVLLDFGLATSIDPNQQSTHAMGVGTAVYMAPEQAGGRSISAAADLYALGVCLFEALTGQAPFEGTHALKILIDKQTKPARRPSELVASVPFDLDALCVELLAADPAQRPSAEQALAALSRGSLPASLQPPRGAAGEDFFAGRDAELTHLERALARTHEGELRVVLIEGESGVGKSELVSEFLRRTRANEPRMWVLRGRCYENEQVTYKAFDGCIDDLAKLLRRMSQHECRAILPERAALLGQLFPVLRNLKAISNARREGSSADPAARRLEAFAALSQLLTKVAEDRPLVLVLDDLQWADAESFRLLAALAEQSPRPPILLVGTVRPRNELEREVEEQLESLRRQRHVDVVPLSGLPREQAKALAGRLFAKAVPEAWLSMIAEESQGHPLFIGELVQYTHSHDFAARGHLTLEAALRARIDRLDRRERELLELVALAARPHPSKVFAAALNAGIEEETRSLLAAKLLRQRRGDEIGCYHDRIRHAAAELVFSSRLPALHHQLARALEQLPDVDAAESALHWDMAGEAARASAAYELSAGRAFEALAFDKAAQLYARALALAGGDFDERKQQLTVKRADALSASGLYREAAALYRSASDAAHGETRIHLRGTLAAHLLLSGATRAGLDAARALLTELGFFVPPQRALAAVRYAWDRLCLALNGRRTHASSQASASRDLALSVLREMRRAIMIADPVTAIMLGAQYVRRALRSGSIVEVAYGLTWRGWAFASRQGMARARPLLRAGQALLAQGQPTHSERAAQITLSGSAHMAGSDWAEAATQLSEAHEIAREHCGREAMLLTSIRYHLGFVWYMLGDHARIAREVPGWLAEARERNDVLAIALLTGLGNGFVRHLLVDDPQAALVELENCAFTRPGEPYGIAQLGQFIATSVALLYSGGAGSLQFVERYRKQYGRELLLRAGMGLHALLITETLGALAAHAAGETKERAPLLRRARRASVKLMRTRVRYPEKVGRLALAQIEALEGQRERAVALAEDVMRAGQSFPMEMWAAKYLLGLLEGGEAGQEKCDAVLAEFARGGWRNPKRVLNIYLPSAPLLSQRRSEKKSKRKVLLLDRYEITGQLGSGGFGAVVAARDVRSGHKLAIKELVRSGGTSIERFKREFRALADVHHQNIVQLEALFEHDGRWYIAMELVEGVDLVSHVRASGSCDAARLASTFLSLASALQVLHQLGFVHRDVKPENVIVTAQGRPVLIDFGLIARAGQKPEGALVGSVEFGAPEQLGGATPGPASDVFSLGACLFNALSGRPPFAREQLDPLRRTPDARVLPELPGLASARALCLQMLASAPEQRPSLDEVIARLAPSASTGLSSRQFAQLRVTLDDASPEWTFAGREAELAKLSGLFRADQRAGPSVVLVEGESGLGKSALVSQFAGVCQRETPLLHVLRSSCYENEQVAFKAFDRAIDQLADLLRALPESHCEALLPKRAALLSQLFPVLAGVPAIEHAGKKGLPAEPAARKQAGEECFAQLLAALCSERRLLLLIDDLQWADPESFDLLRALIAHGAPLAPLFVVCTVRRAGENETAVQREIDGLCALPRVSRMTLGLLDELAGMQLARQLLGAERDAESLSAIVQESKGHPLFLRELIEHDRRGLSGRNRALTLDDALGARIDSLSDEARALLELTALLGKPYGLPVFERALSPAGLSRVGLASLLGHGLVQRRGDKLACYHDRIRQVTLARMSGEQRARLARNLASALNADLRADPADRARLWDEAGEAAEAIAAYELSGAQALLSLAFARAEADYRRALTLCGELRDARFARLSVARGHALVAAGRSAEAARMFQQAAELVDGEEKVRLRVWTAQHLILSAQVEQGLSAATKLLSELGLSLPNGDKAALARIGYERARVALRGVELGARKAGAHERLVLDALHGLCSPVRDCSYLPGSALMVQYLRRALDAGDPIHSARALAYEALYRSVNRSYDQRELFEKSRALAEATADPALIAEVDLTRGLACVSQRQMLLAPEFLWRAHDLLQTQCPGQPWLLTASRVYLGMAWYHGGNMRDLRRHMGGWIDEARERDDQFAVAALAGFGAGSFRHAAEDDPERGIEELEQAMANWPAPPPFTLNHVGAFLTRGILLLCADRDGARLSSFLAGQRAQLDRAYLMSTPSLRLALQWLRTSSALRSIDRLGVPASHEALVCARAETRVLRRVTGPLGRSTYLFLTGWIALAAGDRESALRAFTQAREVGAGADSINTVGIRYSLAYLLGGEEGRRLREEVQSQLEAFGFKNWQLALRSRIPAPLSLLGF